MTDVAPLRSKIAQYWMITCGPSRSSNASPLLALIETFNSSSPPP